MYAVRSIIAVSAALALALASAPLLAGWTYQQGNGNQDDNLLAVGAASGTMACAAGFSQSGGNPSPLFFRTTDGEVWAAAGGQGYGGAVAFIDETRALMGTLFGKILISSDGCGGWTEIPEATLGAGTMMDGDFPIEIAVARDGQTIWIAGESGKCSYSDDGGQTWTRTTVQFPGTDTSLMSAAAVGQRVWLAGGRPSAQAGQDAFGDPIPGHPAGQGFVLRSDDGGQTFETVASNLPYAVNSLSFVNLDEGWLAGGTNDTGGAVLGRTADGGANWSTGSPPDLPDEECFVGMGATTTPGTCRKTVFFGREVGVALCSTSTWEFDGSNALFLTDDGGDTWRHQGGYRAAMPGSGLAEMALVTSPIVDVAFPDCRRGWLVGGGRIIMRWDNDDQQMDCEAGGGPSEDGAPEGGGDDGEGDDGWGSCDCVAAGVSTTSLFRLLISLFS